MKEPVRGEIAPKKISHIQFGLLSATEMERLSEFQVYRSDLFTMPQVHTRLSVSLSLRACAVVLLSAFVCVGLLKNRTV